WVAFWCSKMRLSPSATKAPGAQPTVLSAQPWRRRIGRQQNMPKENLRPRLASASPLAMSIHTALGVVLTTVAKALPES
ncbi:MAG: hypothetical protein AAFW95_14535, partial [Cyanobacteria bacterium J06638_6]